MQEKKKDPPPPTLKFFAIEFWALEKLHRIQMTLCPPIFKMQNPLNK